jgi:hypothetical protein
MKQLASHCMRFFAVALLLVVSAPTARTGHTHAPPEPPHSTACQSACHNDGGSPADHAPVPHDEHRCVVCDLLATGLTSAIPPAAASVASVQPPHESVRLCEAATPSLFESSDHQARAPPIL